ncbi:response regulator [Sorangium sp. So ce861]|uniref:response regulator n=1 Tax=Sorangium sp. So ce861 TaxID=3133323 RepID=UPI003F5E1D4B
MSDRNTTSQTKPPPAGALEGADTAPSASASSVIPPSGAMTAPVLVIDDSELAREEVSRILRDAGWQVVALPSPIGATQAIVRHQARVVIVDVFMPTLRGDRLLTLFRKNPRLGHLSVILMSGHSEQELERLQMEAQADAVISKRNLQRLPVIVRRLASKDR